MHHPEIDQNGKWVETAQCYLCDQHRKTTMFMTEFDERPDQDFAELMQLGNLIKPQDIEEQPE